MNSPPIHQLLCFKHCPTLTMRTGIASFLLIFGLQAQSAQAQSLGSLYDLAAKHDPSYQSAQAAVDANLAKAAQAKAGLLPTLGLSASRTASRSQTDSQSSAGGGFVALDPRSYGAQSYGLNFSLPLFRPANWATYAQGQRSAEVAQSQLAFAEQDLVLRAAQAYFDVLGAEETVRTITAQQKATREQLAAAKRNFEVGNSTITDTREAQARADLISAQLAEAENDLQTKQLILNDLTGLDNTKPLPLKPKVLPSLLEVNKKPKQTKPANASLSAIQTWVENALAHSSTLLQARKALEIAELEERKAQSGHLPTLDLTASLSNSKSIDGTSSSALNSRSTNRSIGLSFNMPLFAGFATQERIHETEALTSKARADLLVAERSVSQTTKSLFLRSQSIQAQIKAYEAAELSSQSALDATKLGYQVGVRINADVLSAQTQLYQTKRDLAKARFDYILTQLKLLQTAGKLSRRHLEEVDFYLDKGVAKR